MDAISPDPEFRRLLVTACGSFGVAFSARQIALLWRHLCLARAANEAFNLTRITDSARAAVEHYADSMTLLPWLRERPSTPRRALDVGTGGGWPAVPLAIMQPEVRWTAIDSTGKKARFVGEAAAALGLANFDARQARARELAGKVEPFDLVVCRAVGKLPDLVTEVRRLIAPGGCFVCYKTPQMSDLERRAGELAARRSRLETLPEFAIDLESDGRVFRRLLVAYAAGPQAAGDAQRRGGAQAE